MKSPFDERPGGAGTPGQERQPDGGSSQQPDFVVGVPLTAVELEALREWLRQLERDRRSPYRRLISPVLTTLHIISALVALIHILRL
jgi:hypothetical protein